MIYLLLLIVTATAYCSPRPRTKLLKTIQYNAIVLYAVPLVDDGAALCVMCDVLLLFWTVMRVDPSLQASHRARKQRGFWHCYVLSCAFRI